jgi:hypothetical protein
MAGLLQPVLPGPALSISIAQTHDAIDAALNTICSSHGAAEAPADEAPADQAPAGQAPACPSCPICSNWADSHLVVVQRVAVDVVLTSARTLAFELRNDLHIDRFLTRPRSRGPPSIAV